MRNEAKRTVRKVKTGRTALGFLTILLVLVLAVRRQLLRPSPLGSRQPTPPSKPATTAPSRLRLPRLSLRSRMLLRPTRAGNARANDEVKV